MAAHGVCFGFVQWLNRRSNAAPECASRQRPAYGSCQVHSAVVTTQFSGRYDVS